MQIINVSVHEIVDFLTRKGDIDSRVFNSSTMQIGSQMHEIYQSKQGENYLSEVSVSTILVYKSFEYHINGRIDGLIIENNKVIIDEIKTTNTLIEKFFLENKDWHLSQAEFYGYMYAKEHGCNNIEILLTYISQNTNEREIKSFLYNFSEIEEKIYKYIEEYSSFRSIIYRKQKSTLKSLSNLSFPFPFIRDGQELLIEKTKECALTNKNIFIEASTGIGKTISTIYGSLFGIKEQKINRIFYLTAKNSGFESANKALEDLRGKEILLTSVEIQAKTKMCINTKKVGRCNPEECVYTIGYYSKLREILSQELIKPKMFTKKNILKLAYKYKICPFELALDISSYSDFIICDYNYAFNKISLLKRYFVTSDKEYNKFLLVDEAHNLIDRGREMYSQRLPLKLFNSCEDEFNIIVDKKLNKIILDLKKYIKLFNDFLIDKNLVVENYDEDFILTCEVFLTQFQKYKLDSLEHFPLIDDLTLELYKFTQIYHLALNDNDIFKLFLEKENDEIVLCIKCLDASKFIKDTVYKCCGSVFFSATLSPVSYYENLLLSRNDLESYTIPSPFNKDNLKILINKNISLLYKDRKSSLNKVIEMIKTFCLEKKGNYIVYCPSFEYLGMLLENFNLDNVDFIVQKRNMNIEEKNDFLDFFSIVEEKVRIAFCVIGGSFSEGIDLIGEKLIGVVIIGIGLPMVNYENKLLKDYYASIGYDGYEYAFLNVGINKVMQAVGRVIRSENDRGAVLLIDRRYGNNKFLNLFNSIWLNHKFIESNEELINELDKFFNANQ